MLGIDNHKTYWTREEAKALVGKVVNTNAGTRVVIVTAICVDDDEFMVADRDGYMYKKVCANALYCWV